MAIPIAIAVILWFLPAPQGVDVKAWHLLAIFAGTIVGLISQPLPMGAVVLMGITALPLTHTLKPDETLIGFTNPTVWLIVMAFLFSTAFSKSGFGRRIALLLIGKFGRSTLGLGYALAISDLILAPGIPSGAARTGGVLYPITQELATSFGSEPGPTANRIGAFLMNSTYHAHDVTCAMFMTAMAANPMITEFALKTANVSIGWGEWCVGALVPGVLTLIALPYMLYKLINPEIKHTPEAPDIAHRELAKLGPVSRDEIIVGITFLCIILLWLTGKMNKMEPAFVAFLGICVLLLTGVLQWKDILATTKGWDSLIWFGGLVGMATMLNKLGLIKWFAAYVGAHVAGLPWLPTLLVLTLVYFYSQYAFASLTAHASAMYVPFLTVAIAAGAPPRLAILILAYFSSLCVCLTHYGGGPSPIFFGAGYIGVRKWWGLGFAVSILYIAIWMGIGSIYWKMLGYY
jgi:DASS family divalent anion:Na+ symporter